MRDGSVCAMATLVLVCDDYDARGVVRVIAMKVCG